MSERKKRIKRLMAVALSLAVIGGSVNLPAVTSFAEDEKTDQVNTSETETDKNPSETGENDKKPEDKKTEETSGASEVKKPEDKGQGSSETKKTEDKKVEESQESSKNETDKEKKDEIFEETADLGDYIYQCGGLGTIDMPMMLSLDGEERNRAASGTEAAKEGILEGLTAWKAEIDVSPYEISPDEAKVLFAQVVNENPQLFYVTGGASFSYSGTAAISIRPVYNSAYTQQSVQTYNIAFNKAYNEALPDPAGMSKVQIARALHDYLAQHMRYDESLKKYDAYTAFVEGTAVCQGYTLAYGAMLKKAGIPFEYAESEAMNHIWNLVQIDGKWYHVDVTWDDPLADKLGYVRYHNFLASDTEIKRQEHHDWTAAQVCDSTAYDNAYWKSGVSAIFTIGGKEYYLKYPATGFNNQLVCRSGDKEEILLTFRAQWTTANGGYWEGSYSRLSYYDGKLYFNDPRNVYRVDPKAASVADSKKTVYTYTGNDGDLYGSLVCDNMIKFEVSANPNDAGVRKEEPLPTGAIQNVTVTIEPSSVTYGYTEAPKMKAAVTGIGEMGDLTYAWYNVTDGNETPMSSTGAECEADLGLPVGTYAYRVKVSCEDGEASANVTLTVLPKKVTPEVNVTGEYFYDETGAQVIPDYTVIVKAENADDIDDKLAEDKDYTVEFQDNTNAGTAKMVITAKEGGNYTWDPLTVPFTINKIDKIEGNVEEYDTEEMYGNTGSYDLELPEGAVLGQIQAEDPDQILTRTPVVTEGRLSFALADDSENVDKKAVVTIPVTGSTNYNPYNIKLTITVCEKLPQTEFDFVNSYENRIYGDPDFVIATVGAAEGSKVTYSIENTEIATVDNAGKVHIKKAGKTRIIAVASSTNEYAQGYAYCELIVSKILLSWDTSELGAADKADNEAGDAKKDAQATLYGKLKISGVIGSDDVKFECAADRLMGTYRNLNVGKQEVSLAWKDGAPVEPTGADADNYTCLEKLPAITGIITKTTIQDVEVEGGESDTKYKLKIESGMTSVPKGLEDRFESPVAITNRMNAGIISRIGEMFGINSAETAEVEVYDITLCMVDEDGNLVEVDDKNFPKDGLVVKLDYPEGTGKDTHNFVVAHMLTIDTKSLKAGEIEFPTVTKTDGGIEFKVSSLSPIGLGWSKMQPAGGNGGSGGGNDGNGGSSNGNGSSVDNNKKPTAPKTGDGNMFLLYVLFMVLGAAGVRYTAKRRMMQ